jgi:hypothetical protein
MKRARRGAWKWLLLAGAGLAAGLILLTSPVRLVFGTPPLIALLGGYLIYFGLWGSKRGLANPDFARWLSLGVGGALLLGGTLGTAWVLNNASTPAGTARQRIERAAAHGEQSLNLSDMGLGSLPVEVAQLSELQALYLDRNRLTALPVEIGHLANLKKLDLHNNRLGTLPAEIGRLTSLTHLNLNDNRLSALPGEIGQLSSLERLDLQDNRLTALPPEIGQLAGLKSLYLRGNRLTALPPEIGRLTSLEYLFLEGNQLPGLPPEMGQLSNLKTLVLSGNPLDKVPPEVARLAATGGLYIERGALSRPPLGIDFDVFFPITMVLAFVAGLALNWWIGRREAALCRKGRELGQVFAIPPFSRAALLIVLLLIGLVMVVVFVASLNPERTTISREAGIGVPLLLSPLALFALYMLVNNSGMVILTREAVILRRLGRNKQLPYRHISGIKERTFSILPSLVLKGEDVTLKINRRVENLPGLYAAIRQRTEGERGGERPAFPYHLAVGRSTLWFGVAGAVILLAFYLGTGLAGLWVPAWQGTEPALLPGLLIMGLVSLIFLPVIAIFVVGWFKPRQPSELRLTVDEVRFRYLLGSWQIWAGDELSSIELQPMHLPVWGSRPVRIWGTRGGTIVYPLSLHFSGQRRLLIDQDRAWQFGYSPERLFDVLRRLYEPRGVVCKIAA